MFFEDPRRSARFEIWMRKAVIRIGYTVIHEDWNSGLSLSVKNSAEGARHVQRCHAIHAEGVSVHKKIFRSGLELLPRKRRDQIEIYPLFYVPIIFSYVLK